MAEALVLSKIEAAVMLRDPAIGLALAELSWHRVSRLRNSTSGQRMLVYKIKGARLSGWSRSLQARGCPHCPTLGSSGGDTFHITWHCPAAQRLWRLIRDFWERLGLWRRQSTPNENNFLHAVFSIRLPTTPVGATPYADSKTGVDADVLHELLQHIWTGQVLSCFKSLWSWRHGADDEEHPWDFNAARSALRSQLVASLRSLDSKTPVGARGLRHLLVLCRHLVSTTTPLPPEPPRPQAEFVLFFDGGSRGNPGPGGAGAIVVRTDPLRATARIVWSAAMSLAAATTTNNQAEYIGLVTGLAAADKNNWRPLDVVGDSKLIITQLAQRRPPRDAVLHAFYQAARSLADRLGVDAWHHHLRAYNKMADAAANVAMDGRRSIQTFHPTERPEWVVLNPLLEGDLLHWQASKLSNG